jgi:ABC-type multidrug transport system fused ATPase/permease subunit
MGKMFDHSTAMGMNKRRRMGIGDRARPQRSVPEIIRRLGPYVCRRKTSLLLALACATGYTFLSLLEPWPIKLVFDHILLNHPVPPALAPIVTPLVENRVLFLSLLMGSILLLVVIRGAVYFYQAVLIAKVGQQAATDLRLELYQHLQHLSFSFHDRRRTGDLLMRLTNDIRILRDFLIALPVLVISDFLLTLGMGLVMVLMNWRLTLLALAVLPVLWLVTRTYQQPMWRASRKRRKREGRLATMAAQALGAIKVVQGFRREHYEIERFSTQNIGSLRSGLRATRLEAKLRWTSELAIASVTILILGVGAHNVLAGIMSAGELLVFVYYLRTFSRPLNRISRTVERSTRGLTAAERILDTLDTQPTVTDLAGAVPAPRVQGELFFDHVSFAYHPGGASVLTDVTARIRPKERVAIVGPTGSGKTTLVNLIPRFYDPTHGRVCLDGCDVKTFTLESLRACVSLVFQEPVLFATTIRENIAYGKPDATHEEIERAAEMAGIHQLIASLPEGYETVIGERGGTLSGGQRQCVAIARAIIHDAPLVILDEPTTGLDARSAAQVMEALDRLMPQRTVILVTHQLRLLRHVDRVLVLDGGRLVEEGAPRDLLAREGLYHTLQRVEAGVGA